MGSRGARLTTDRHDFADPLGGGRRVRTWRGSGRGGHGLTADVVLGCAAYRVVLLAALVVIFVDRPTGGDILVVSLLLVVLLGVIEFLNQPWSPEEPRLTRG